MSQQAFWAKCPGCGHCWPAAYLPMEMAKMGELLKRVQCPKGCPADPLVAKQKDGVLTEPGSPT